MSHHEQHPQGKLHRDNLHKLGQVCLLGLISILEQEGDMLELLTETEKCRWVVDKQLNKEEISMMMNVKFDLKQYFGRMDIRFSSVT